MQMLGEQFIAASKEKVWEGLNDPEVLRQSIPGCQSLTKESDTRMTATVEVKVGPIGARFKGAVSLEDIQPAQSYTLIIEGNGGIAGSMKGTAKVSLAQTDGGTLVKYEVEAEVGGRMAQLGGPIIDATAKQLSAKFFSRFGEIVSGVAPAATGSAAAGAPQTAPQAIPQTTTVAAAPTGGGFWKGFAMGLLLLLVALLAFEYGRSSATPTIVLDNELLQEIAEKLLQEVADEHSAGDQ